MTMSCITVEPLLKVPLNKGQSTFDLSIKHKFSGLYTGPWWYNLSLQEDNPCIAVKLLQNCLSQSVRSAINWVTLLDNYYEI